MNNVSMDFMMEIAEAEHDELQLRAENLIDEGLSYNDLPYYGVPDDIINEFMDEQVAI